MERKATAALFKRLYHCCGHTPHKTTELQPPGRQWAHTELMGNDQVPWGTGKHKETSKLQGVAGLSQESNPDLLWGFWFSLRCSQMGFQERSKTELLRRKA